MAYSKTIYCLAIAKHGRGRAIAGKTPDGEWVRPVSSASRGEFFPEEYRYGTGETPRPLDQMSITFDGPASTGHHRENHAVSHEPWMRKGALAYEELSAFTDNPTSLWGPPRNSSNPWEHAIPAEAAQRFDHSLLLIKPDTLQMRVGVEGRLSQRLALRAFFRYRDAEYFLPVTDAFAQLAFLDKGLGHYRLNAHLCLGLTQPSADDGLCHKVVLGVIDPHGCSQ